LASAATPNTLDRFEGLETEERRSWKVLLETLSVKECDDLRHGLARRGEWLPDAFLKRSFSDGLPMFYARLLDNDLQAIGSATPMELRLAFHRIVTPLALRLWRKRDGG
jgi:hypothetical protein